MAELAPIDMPLWDHGNSRIYLRAGPQVAPVQIGDTHSKTVFLGWVPGHPAAEFARSSWYSFPTLSWDQFDLQIGNARYHFNLELLTLSGNRSQILWAIPEHEPPLSHGYQLTAGEEFDAARDAYDIDLRGRGVNLDNVRMIGVCSAVDSLGTRSHGPMQNISADSSATVIFQMGKSVVTQGHGSYTREFARVYPVLQLKHRYRQGPPQLRIQRGNAPSETLSLDDPNDPLLKSVCSLPPQLTDSKTGQLITLHMDRCVPGDLVEVSASPGQFLQSRFESAGAPTEIPGNQNVAVRFKGRTLAVEAAEVDSGSSATQHDITLPQALYQFLDRTQRDIEQQVHQAYDSRMVHVAGDQPALLSLYKFRPDLFEQATNWVGASDQEIRGNLGFVLIALAVGDEPTPIDEQAGRGPDQEADRITPAEQLYRFLEKKLPPFGWDLLLALHIMNDIPLQLFHELNWVPQDVEQVRKFVKNGEQLQCFHDARKLVVGYCQTQKPEILDRIAMSLQGQEINAAALQEMSSELNRYVDQHVVRLTTQQVIAATFEPLDELTVVSLDHLIEHGKTYTNLLSLWREETYPAIYEHFQNSDEYSEVELPSADDVLSNGIKNYLADIDEAFIRTARTLYDRIGSYAEDPITTLVVVSSILRSENLFEIHADLMDFYLDLIDPERELGLKQSSPRKLLTTILDIGKSHKTFGDNPQNRARLQRDFDRMRENMRTLKVELQRKPGIDRAYIERTVEIPEATLWAVLGFREEMEADAKAG